MIHSFRLALFVATACAQTKYGENHVTVNRDPQVVEQTAFPAPNGTLYSPAFSADAAFAPGWTKGSEGATSPDKLGMSMRTHTFIIIEKS